MFEFPHFLQIAANCSAIPVAPPHKKCLIGRFAVWIIASLKKSGPLQRESDYSGVTNSAIGKCFFVDWMY